MKKTFYIPGILLCLDGLLHLVKLVTGPWDANASIAMVITGLFGLAYLAIGIMLLMLRESIVWAAVVLPAVGLALTFIGMKPNPDSLTIVFIILDILAIASSAYILYLGRAPLHRVR